jgi:hypothetical protein
VASLERANVKSKLIDISVIVLRETNKAYFVSDTGEETDGVWVPKSQVEYDRNDKTITLPEWLAIEKKLV